MEKREKARQYWFVVQQLTARELKRKYARSVLGVVWSVLNPLLSMAVLSLIFSQLFRRSIENSPIYYLTGYLLWQAFTATTNAAMTTLADNRALLLKVKFPMELFILTRGATALVNLGYSLVAYGVMLVVFQVPLRWTLAYLPVVVACLFLFALGISYLLSAAYVFFGGLLLGLDGGGAVHHNGDGLLGQQLILHLVGLEILLDGLQLHVVLLGHLLPGGPALRVHPSGGGG